METTTVLYPPPLPQAFKKLSAAKSCTGKVPTNLEALTLVKGQYSLRMQAAPPV